MVLDCRFLSVFTLCFSLKSLVVYSVNRLVCHKKNVARAEQMLCFLKKNKLPSNTVLKVAFFIADAKRMLLDSCFN